MAFEVTVLGASGTYPTPDSSCPGYLLSHEGRHVWVDAGTGTFANLQRHVDFRELEALVISHLHLDHILDIYMFYYALRYGMNAVGPGGFPVYAPAGAENHLTKLLTLQDPGANFGGYFSFHEISPGTKMTIASFDFEFARSVHPIETLAMRVTAGRKTLAYTADTGGGDELGEFAKGADSLICEASLQQADADLVEVHLTAEEAGALSEKAGVKRLVLTHISPGLDPDRSVEQARKHYSGDILVAGDNVTFTV